MIPLILKMAVLTKFIFLLPELWYRAVVIEEIEHDLFRVLFVDFGNKEDVTKQNLRRFPLKYSKIPILGISAYFMGRYKTRKCE